MATTYSFKENTITTTIQTPPVPGNIVVENDAVIAVTAADAFDLASGPWTITLNGSVRSGSANGIDLGASALAKNARLTVGAEGGLFGAGAAMDTDQAIDVTNSGDIHGGFIGLAFESVAASTKSFTITNNADATIFGGQIGIENLNPTWVMNIKNSGLIDSGSTDAIDFVGSAVINNQGSISGSIVTLLPTLLKSSLTNGKDATIGGDIEFSNGDDTVSNSGTIFGDIKLFDGKNTLTNSFSIFGDIDLGSGADTVKNTGTVTGAVAMAGGADKFTNSGTIDGTVAFGDGDNMVTNSGTVTGAVTFGNDDSTLTNSGEFEDDVTFAGGDNHVTNSGTIAGNLILGAGEDVVSNKKLVGGSIVTGDGDDTVTNSGTAISVGTGAGNDVFKNTGTVTGFINLGDDDDVFTGGNGIERIQDSAGNDSYKLGGGNDFFACNGAGTFTIDAGAGTIDAISFGNSGSVSFAVNFDTKSVTLDGHVLAAQSVQGSNASGGSIKGFEVISGSQEGDLFAGGATADRINGVSGDDFIAGGLGADDLSGGLGDDTFVYFGIKESGATRTTRDIIEDFTTGDDKIDLNAIDANTKLANNQDFAWIGVNAQYSGQGAEVRAVIVGGHTIVEGDINGDSKTDFSIDLVGVINLTGADFTL